MNRPAPQAYASAPLILVNGRFHTNDRSKPQASAAAIQNGRFLAVGDSDEVMRHRTEERQVIDLNGRTVILYATLSKGPALPRELQVNSTRQFVRELNRLGVTSVIDAGGAFQNYPEDYSVVDELARADQLTVRVAYNLFTQNKGQELGDFQTWTDSVELHQGTDWYRHNGAGEMLVFSAADFEDFLQPRPDLPDSMEDELEKAVRHLVAQRWPFRLHATYDESIDRMLDVFEKVSRDIPFDGH